MPRQTPADQTPVRCGGPGDALDAIPWMLGFAPAESLVLLGLIGPRRRFGPVLRLDLHDPAIDAVVVAEALELLLSRAVCEEVILVAYTDEGSKDPLAPLPRQALLLEASRQLAAAGVGIRDSVVARHGRWWSLLCDNPLCCAPEGTSMEHDVPSPIEIAYRRAGVIPPMRSREALIDSLRLRPQPAVEAELRRLFNAGPELILAGTLETQLREVFDHYLRRRGMALPPAALALLIFLVQQVPVRDQATELPGGDELADAVALWRAVYAVTPAACRPHVGAVLAVLAWEAGAFALAASTCESVFEIDPGHNLCRLTRSLLDSGIRPDPRPGRPRPARQPRLARANRGWRR